MRSIVLAVALIGAAHAEAPDPSASAAADRFLALLVAHDYDTAWNQSCAEWRKQTPRAAFRSTFAPEMRAVGKLVRREAPTAKRLSTLEGVGDGIFLRLIYNSEFARVRRVQETVMVALRNGAWCAIGYAIDYKLRAIK